ncbi:MAG: DUF3164 family protein [Rhizobiales bacterium]|nr:DUF3164 family protein [Hyphomicrobiales bacterium]
MVDESVILPPKGFWENAKGDYVRVEKIQDIDKARDKVVKKLIRNAEKTQSILATVKDDAFDEIAQFLQLSASKYGIKLGGEKGNVTLLSYDGRYKVQRTIAEHIHFDERLQIAKHMIDECIQRWQKGSNHNIQVLINDAFQVDKEGKVSTSRILGLRKHKMNDPEWDKAMEAIADSIQVSGSKSYVRFYERDKHGKYIAISLDIASVEGAA